MGRILAGCCGPKGATRETAGDSRGPGRSGVWQIYHVRMGEKLADVDSSITAVAGDTVKVTLWRGSKVKTVEVTLGERPNTVTNQP